MARFISFEDERLGYGKINAMDSAEFEAASQEDKDHIFQHAWVWQNAFTKQQAIEQHDRKHNQWSDDQHTNTEKETY